MRSLFCLVHFSKIALLLNLQGLLTISPNHLGQDTNVCTEEGEALEPDEQEGVVTLELQHVGRQQPRALSESPQHSTWKEKSLSSLTVLRSFIQYITEKNVLLTES